MKRTFSWGSEILSSKDDIDIFLWYNLGHGHCDFEFSYLSNESNDYY